jgi:hypothetical protein
MLRYPKYSFRSSFQLTTLKCLPTLGAVSGIKSNHNGQCNDRTILNFQTDFSLKHFHDVGKAYYTNIGEYKPKKERFPTNSRTSGFLVKSLLISVRSDYLKSVYLFSFRIMLQNLMLLLCPLYLHLSFTGILLCSLLFLRP